MSSYKSLGEPSLVVPGAANGLRGAGEALSLAMMTCKFWKVGSKLRIGFQGGSEWQKDQVRKYAPEWCRYANIKFLFVNSGELDVLVAFNPMLGSWSHVGTDCKTHSSKNQPSMNLSRIDKSSAADTIHGDILHEFGHVLGAVHEHSSPSAQIPWNADVVYKALGGPPDNWNEEYVDLNVLHRYSSTEVQASEFDPDSIMLYCYPTNWTEDGSCTKHNTKLSESDKKFARSCYPFDKRGTGIVSRVRQALSFH